MPRGKKPVNADLYLPRRVDEVCGTMALTLHIKKQSLYQPLTPAGAG